MFKKNKIILNERVKNIISRRNFLAVQTPPNPTNSQLLSWYFSLLLINIYNGAAVEKEAEAKKQKGLRNVCYRNEILINANG